MILGKLQETRGFQDSSVNVTSTRITTPPTRSNLINNVCQFQVANISVDSTRTQSSRSFLCFKHRQQEHQLSHMLLIKMWWFVFTKTLPVGFLCGHGQVRHRGFCFSGMKCASSVSLLLLWNEMSSATNFSVDR